MDYCPWTQSMPSRDVNAATRLADLSSMPTRGWYHLYKATLREGETKESILVTVLGNLIRNLLSITVVHIYEMNFTLCVLLVYNDNGSVQTLCITRVSALCKKCLHRPIVIINQQYTKGEIHFIYLHYFHVFRFCFINRYHGNGCVSLENTTVCTVNGRA